MAVQNTEMFKWMGETNTSLLYQALHTIYCLMNNVLHAKKKCIQNMTFLVKELLEKFIGAAFL